MMLRSFILALLALLAIRSTAAAGPLPKDYAGQLRMVQLEGGEAELGRVASLETLAKAENNHTFLQLIALYKSQYTLTAGADRTQIGVELHRIEADFEAHGEFLWHLDALCALARYYWVSNQPGRSAEYAFRAQAGYASLDGATFPLKYRALYEVCIAHYYFRDYASARRYLQEALHTQGAVEIPERFNLENTLGLCYRNEGRLDSAEYWLRLSLRHAVAANNRIWRGIILGNLGINAYLQGNFTAAIPLLQEDIRVSDSLNNAAENRVKSLAILGEILLRSGRLAEAVSALETAQQLVTERGFSRRYHLLEEFYPRLAALREAQGRMQEANALLRAAAAARDSVQAAQNALVLTGAQLQVQAEKQSLAQTVLQQERRLARQTRNMLLLGIALLTVIALLILRQQQARHRFRQEASDRLRQATEAELAEATGQLQKFTTALHEKNRLIERFQQELSVRAEEDEQASSQLRQLTILTEAEWEHFRSLFEKAHAGFLTRLYQKFPDLSPAETRFLVLAKLQFSVKEIAGILGIGDTAVRVTRSRLRKKLDLPEEKGIEELIAAL